MTFTSITSNHGEQPIALYSDTRLRVLYFFVTRYNTTGKQHPFKGFDDFKKHFYIYKAKNPEFFRIRLDKLEYFAVIDDFLMQVERSFKSVDFIDASFQEPDMHNEYYRIVLTIYKRRIKDAHVVKLCTKMLQAITNHEFMKKSVHHWLDFTSGYHYSEEGNEIKITKIIESKLKDECIFFQPKGFTSIMHPDAVENEA